MTHEHFGAGASVIITTDTGREIEGIVVLASKNGLSLALTFDGMIGGWLMGCAVFYDLATASWRTIDGVWIGLRHGTLDDDD